MRARLAGLLAAAAAVAAPLPEDAQLAQENDMLKLKLKKLEDELKQELKYSYVIIKGCVRAPPAPRHAPPAAAPAPAPHRWRRAAASAARHRRVLLRGGCAMAARS